MSAVNSLTTIDIVLCAKGQHTDAELEAWLIDAEREYLATLSKHRRTEWLTGRALVRYLLAQYVDLPIEKMTISTTPQGKPFIAAKGAPAWSVSHSREWVVCAIGQDIESIGVDIEMLHRRNNISAISEHYFAPKESAYLKELTAEADKKNVFFRLWTLKEAYIKALGATISGGFLQQAQVDCNQLLQHPRIDGCDARWQFKQCALLKDHMISIASCGDAQRIMQYRCYQWLPTGLTPFE